MAEDQNFDRNRQIWTETDRSGQKRKTKTKKPNRAPHLNNHKQRQTETDKKGQKTVKLSQVYPKGPWT